MDDEYAEIDVRHLFKYCPNALKKGLELGLKPAVVVLDERASLRICLNQDGTAWSIAIVLRMAKQMQQCL